MSSALSTQINQNIERINELLTAYADLFETIEKQTPDLVQTTALASVLHSFYNGLEGIFVAIAKEIDGELPEGKRWHRDLLEQLSQPNQHRPAVISEALKSQIQEYLAFRHYYRHAYSFFLDWRELQNLVTPLHSVWAQTEQALKQFISTIE